MVSLELSTKLCRVGRGVGAHRSSTVGLEDSTHPTPSASQKHYSGGGDAANATSPYYCLSAMAAGTGSLPTPIPSGCSRVPQRTAATRITVDRSLAGRD